MGNNIVVRKATPADAQELVAIYAPYVRNTAVSFEIEPPTEEEFAARIERTLARYPYLVAEIDGVVAGYAYAGPFKERAGYAASVELSIYVNPDFSRKGVGRTLYTAIERELVQRGVTNLYACVAYPPQEDEYLTYGSVRFHERMGFEIVGRFHGCARKFGRSYDMVWMEKRVV